MGRLIIDFQNTDAPGGGFPYGRVRNNNGTNNGTPVVEETMGDVWQFFARLMALASITSNGDPESSTDGFQFIEALGESVLGKWEDASSLLINGWTVSAGSVFEIRIAGASNLDPRFGDVEFRGCIENASVFANGVFINMPVGFRPLFDDLQHVSGVSGTTFYPIPISLDTSGDLMVNPNTVNQQSDNQPLWVTGLKYSRFAAP